MTENPAYERAGGGETNPNTQSGSVMKFTDSRNIGFRLVSASSKGQETGTFATNYQNSAGDFV